MLYGQDRDQMRQVFLTAWQKFNNAEPLEAMERIIAEVIALHPEYQGLFDNPDQALARDYLPEDGETNPFLHMGLHIAIREQMGAGRPFGLNEVHQQLCEKLGDEHAAEHQMLECLAQEMWQAQSEARVPDEQAYLDCIRQSL